MLCFARNVCNSAEDLSRKPSSDLFFDFDMMSSDELDSFDFSSFSSFTLFKIISVLSFFFSSLSWNSESINS